VDLFRRQVLAGNFEDIPALVSSLVRGQDLAGSARGAPFVEFDLVAKKREFLVEEQVRMIEYLLFEQKYMEHVAQGATLKAIEVL